LIGMLSIGDVAVKTANDKMSGDALEKVSQGVKGGRGTGTGSKGSAIGQAQSSKQNEMEDLVMDERHAGGSRAGVKNSRTGNTQAGKSSSGKTTGSQQNDYLRHSNGLDPEESFEQASGRESTRDRQSAPSISGRSKEQGITNHSEAEENRRQDNVVPFRKDNEVRNKHVQPGKGGKRKSG
jgi:hypothetical protein